MEHFMATLSLIDPDADTVSVDAPPAGSSDRGAGEATGAGAERQPGAGAGSARVGAEEGPRACASGRAHADAGVGARGGTNAKGHAHDAATAVGAHSGGSRPHGKNRSVGLNFNAKGQAVLDLRKGNRLEDIVPAAHRTPEALKSVGAVRLRKYHLSMQRLIELRAMFADADVDANGDLNDAEIVSSMQRRRALRTESTVRMSRKGGKYTRLAEETDRLEKLKMVRSAIERFGGKLSFRNFVGLMLPYTTRFERKMVEDVLFPKSEVTVEEEKVTTEQDSAAYISALFEQMDEDGSGELDIWEFKDMMRKLGVDDPDEIAQYFREIDEDESGRVSVEELTEWWVANGLSR